MVETLWQTRFRLVVRRVQNGNEGFLRGSQKETYNVDTWVQAVRSGNPEAELAFNAGAHPLLSLCTAGKLCPHQTFTSGENHGFYQRVKKGQGKALTPMNFPAPKGVVWHLLMPVSKGWGAGTESKFDLERPDRTNRGDQPGRRTRHPRYAHIAGRQDSRRSLENPRPTGKSLPKKSA